MAEKDLKDLDLKELLKTIKVPKDGDTSKNHVIINPVVKDDKDKGSNNNSTLAAKTISAKLSDKKSLKTEGSFPIPSRTMTGKKTAVRHVNRRYVPAHSVQRAMQGRSLPTAGIQASSTRNEEMDLSEISKKLANRYVQRATTEYGMARNAERNSMPGKARDFWGHKADNRKKGISRAFKTIDKNEGVNEMKTSDSQAFPAGPVDDIIQDPAKYGRSMASKSMATLKQDLSKALANKDAPGQSVVPDGPVKDQLLGAPYNKGKDLSVDDLDVINKEIGAKLDA